jgi:uncharacterized membrane-anchored protein
VKRLRLGLFLALCAVQLAIPLAMAYRYERTLREGTVYKFHTEPFDPVDAFRGRYVAIRLRLVAPPKDHDNDYRTKVFAMLGVDAEGFAVARATSHQAPAAGDWLEGTVGNDLYDMARLESGEGTTGAAMIGTQIELPFDRYYMEEGKAPAADRIWGEGMQQAEAVARVRVRNGLGAIEGLDINGVPIERWIETLPPER